MQHNSTNNHIGKELEELHTEHSNGHKDLGEKLHMSNSARLKHKANKHLKSASTSQVKGEADPPSPRNKYSFLLAHPLFIHRYPSTCAAAESNSYMELNLPWVKK